MRDYEEMTGEKYLQVLLRISCIVCNYICERGSYTCIQCLTLRICNFASVCPTALKDSSIVVIT